MDMMRFNCIARDVKILGEKNAKLSSMAQDAWTYQQWTYVVSDNGFTKQLINSINGRIYTCDYQGKITER